MRIKAQLFYKRISCRHWLITDVQSMLLDSYRYKMWLRDIEYMRAYYPSVGTYAWRGSDPPVCAELKAGQWKSYKPVWEIQAGGYAQVESVDTNPRAQGSFASCTLGEGTSATSAWTFLAGGVS